MTIYLSLYSTSHCHLCEQAEMLVSSVAHVYGAQYKVIEIADDAELLTRYEVKIPVLKRLDTKTEINWPFTTEDIHQLLR